MFVCWGSIKMGRWKPLSFFLDEIGIERKHFVIPNTDSLHPRINEYFPILKRQTLDQYQSVIVFRS